MSKESHGTFELKCINCNQTVKSVSCFHEWEFFKNIRCEGCIQQDTSEIKMIVPDESHIKALMDKNGDIGCERCKGGVDSSIIRCLKDENICINCFMRECFRCKKSKKKDSNLVATAYYIGCEKIYICSECNDNTFEEWINTSNEDVYKKD